MKSIGVLVLVVLKIIGIENRMLPKNYVPKSDGVEEATLFPSEENYQNSHDAVLALKPYEEKYNEDSGFDYEAKKSNEKIKKPCAIVVLSNVQNPTMQSLLRKYRYDANGVLIPSSVKYFIKLPQGLSATPILVPLNDKAFSPLGGFVRYYKEVPPIPQSW